MKKRRPPGDILKELMELHKISANELSRKTGVTQPTISRIVSGAIRDPTNVVLTALAEYFNVSVAVLRDEPGAANLPQSAESNVSSAPRLRVVPLVPWERAGRVMSYRARVEEPGEVVYTARQLGPRAYALRVVGDAMEPKFPEGIVIIVDPDVQPQHGHYVIARPKMDGSVMFKQYVRDGARVYLKPLNTRYPILELAESGTVVGVVRQAVMDCD